MNVTGELLVQYSTVQYLYSYVLYSYVSYEYSTKHIVLYILVQRRSTSRIETVELIRVGLIGRQSVIIIINLTIFPKNIACIELNYL